MSVPEKDGMVPAGYFAAWYGVATKHTAVKRQEGLSYENLSRRPQDVGSTSHHSRLLLCACRLQGSEKTGTD
jgi:hypothetical protein